MSKLLSSVIFITFISITLNAESNSSLEANSSISVENNSTLTKAEKQLEEQIKKEAKFAREQRFYQGDEYNLSSHEVDPNSLDSIPLLEPDYDFDMDDVYD
ncbi:hypothetical protein MNB_SV-13-566 [hydrothermal vent metagenome]|uniref:Uncharacterized protein n=1 Tax=hydrothermal vent metagenome TaxID=652676 RepID=A0A1W1CZD4_9ZZZZ